MNAKSTTWIAGAVIVSLLLSVAVWFLAAGPKFDEAATVNSDAEAQEQRNDLTSLQVAKLRKDFERIDEYKAELAAVRVLLPTQLQLDVLYAEVAKRAEKYDLVITATVGSGAVDVVPSYTPPPVAPETDEDDKKKDDKPSPSPTPSPTPTSKTSEETLELPDLRFEGLIAVPVGFTVIGDPKDAESFVGDLQTGLERVFVANGLQILFQEKRDATGGRPDTALGDVELAFTGLIYVLEDKLTPKIDEPVVPVAPGELPKGGRNIYDPVVIKK